MIVADGFDSCLIGKDSKDRAVYDADAMIDVLVARDDMTREEAEDFFWFNIDDSIIEGGPVYVFLNYERG